MGIYYNLKKSLVRAIVDLSVTALATGSGVSFPSLAANNDTFYRTDEEILYQYHNGNWSAIDIDTFYFDLDLHSMAQELPSHSILTTKGYALETDEHFLNVNVLIGVMIAEDTNMVLHDTVTDKVFDYFLPTKKFPIFDMESNAKIGEFQVRGDIEVMPMMKSDQRPIQFIGITLASNITVNLVTQ